MLDFKKKQIIFKCDTVSTFLKNLGSTQVTTDASTLLSRLNNYWNWSEKKKRTAIYTRISVLIINLEMDNRRAAKALKLLEKANLISVKNILDKQGSRKEIILLPHKLNKDLQENYAALLGYKKEKPLTCEVSGIQKPLTCEVSGIQKPLTCEVSAYISKKGKDIRVKKEKKAGENLRRFSTGKNTQKKERTSDRKKTEKKKSDFFTEKKKLEKESAVNLADMIKSTKDESAKKVDAFEEKKRTKTVHKITHEVARGDDWIKLWFDTVRANGYDTYIRENTKESRGKMADWVKSHYQSDIETVDIQKKIELIVSKWENLRQRQINGLYGALNLPDTPLFNYYYAHRQYIDAALPKKVDVAAQKSRKDIV